MKNKEKFIEQCIKNVDKICDFWDMVCEYKLTCDNHCDECKKGFAKWLEEEYVEKPRLLYDEYLILKNLDKQSKWIARNDNDDLCIYANKPIKHTYRWYERGGTLIFAGYNHLFQFIKWEDEEPYKIQELLEEYESYESYVINNLSLVKK